MGEDSTNSRYPKRVRKPSGRLCDDLAVKIGRNWTKIEVQSLLAALEEYGDQDVSLLASKVRTRSPAQIYNYLASHREAARQQLEQQMDNRLEKYEWLETWIQYMRAKKPRITAPTPLALSMLMISLLEDHPVPTDGEVNFSEAYNYLFRLFAGRHTNRYAELDEPTSRFIKLSCIRLLESTSGNLNVFHERFANAATPDESLKETHLNHLPELIQQLMTSSYFNPLQLKDDVLDIKNTDK